jgi:hypothetical protein
VFAARLKPGLVTTDFTDEHRFLGFGYFEWVEVLTRLTLGSRTPLPEFHPASVQSGESYSEEFGAVVISSSDLLILMGEKSRVDHRLHKCWVTEFRNRRSGAWRQVRQDFNRPKNADAQKSVLSVVYLFSDPRLTLKRQCSPDFSGEH